MLRRLGERSRVRSRANCKGGRKKKGRRRRHLQTRRRKRVQDLSAPGKPAPQSGKGAPKKMSRQMLGNLKHGHRGVEVIEVVVIQILFLSLTSRSFGVSWLRSTSKPRCHFTQSEFRFIGFIGVTTRARTSGGDAFPGETPPADLAAAMGCGGNPLSRLRSWIFALAAIGSGKGARMLRGAKDSISFAPWIS